MRVAGALLPLGGAALGNGHGSFGRVREWGESGALVAEAPQRVPAWIGTRVGAAARPGIEVGSAARTEPRTIGPAFDERRRAEEPLFPNHGPQIEIRGPWIELEDVWINA